MQKSVGLLVGGDVDERYDVTKATEAACRYLADAYERLGSWTLAAASYNVGIAGVSRRLAKQGVDSYYDLFLPAETLRYVFRVLAFKLIAPDPAAYGFRIDPRRLLQAADGLPRGDGRRPADRLAAVARSHGTNYKMLRELNHWIRDYDYDNKAGRSFVIKVPNRDFRRAR